MSPRPSSDAESPIPSPNAASCQGCGGNAAVTILRQGTGWRPRWKGREVHGSLRCARAGGSPGQTLPRVSHSATVAFLPPPPSHPRRPCMLGMHAGLWILDLQHFCPGEAEVGTKDMRMDPFSGPQVGLYQKSWLPIGIPTGSKVYFGNSMAEGIKITPFRRLYVHSQRHSAPRRGQNCRVIS